MNSRRAFFGAFQAECLQLRRSPLLIALTIIQAVTFIFLVNFFGMTGAFAPTALIDNDHGYYAKALIENLKNAHHSFDLRFMDETSARVAVKQRKIVAMIIIPKGFSEAIDDDETTPLQVIVDNIDTDMTADIQRALPSAITSFGNDFQLPEIHVQTKEFDVINHDTGFIPYLLVSALALGAFIVSGILGGITVAREFEAKTSDLLVVSPINPLIPLLGRVLATNIISAVTMIICVSIMWGGHGIVPVHPFELFLGLAFCILIFSWMGAAFGAAIKQTLPVASLIFGISLPLYLFSGTYEPERFDGNLIWIMAHFTPLYYAVGIFEHAILDLRVTPESVLINFLVLAGWAILSLLAIAFFVRRRTQ
jgi:ABC-2 type transport system permease protein